MKILALNKYLKVVSLSNSELHVCKEIAEREPHSTIHFQSFVGEEEKFVAVSSDETISDSELRNILIKKFGGKFNYEFK
ncbi:hypothetical protein [Streptococcus suis]